jgi:hypothetical protein
MKSRVVQWAAAQADDVRRFCLNAMSEDVALFVPIGINLHATLLHVHAAQVLVRVKGEAGGIGFHQRLL